MSGFKRTQIALRVAKSEFALTPDEIDRYEVFNWTPAIDATFLATAGTSGTADTVAMAIKNRYPDTPRNINFAIAGSSAGMTGTLTVNGRDQFGVAITEALTFASASNGGTVAGTKVFLEITTGTLTYGTYAGIGTPAIGFVPGTACLLGLPVKLNGTTDVVFLGMVAGTGAITYGGGTVAAFVNSPMSAIRPAATLTGTTEVQCWVNPTWNNESKARMANGTQAV